ncbi:homoserine kinase [Bacillus timonensis]|uniref:Homoserine kinase n=1 Tax=Bacillus timonensis TaxID=1033734 RepID=A0A4S3PKE4_9BACI|nr:homoserine kinase [Bacillus timonensis]THE09869.1 homoserine kinase [Bacillus timonensis]
MKFDQAFQIKVPASTANLGPGFDSLGLAVNRYLTLQVEPCNQWEFVPQSAEIADTPTNKENFIYQIAAKVASIFSCELPPCKVYVNSNIPLARGLGSSAAAIIAAIELVNELCHLQLTNQQKLELACDVEGHPDNVGASLYGGLVIGSHRGSEDTDLIHVSDVSFDMVVVIPPYELKTKDARSVLPTELSYQEAVKASSISNVMVAALLTKNLELMGKMMELDLFHQAYRAKLIPEFNSIHRSAKRAGAFGVAISGAGPTVICFTENGRGKQLKADLSLEFEGYQVEEVSIEKNGSKLTTLSLHE